MARAWTLVSRPTGMPTNENFALVDLPSEPLADGQFRVRNHYLSVDPYMRGRMNDTRSYTAPFELSKPMQGGAVGEVIESRHPGFAVGDKVQHMAGWRDEAVLSDSWMPNKLPALDVPLQLWLSSLGLTGGTAWFGLMKVAQAKAGDVLFVSAAAGAVGSAAIQIAKAKGLTAIGSAGGADKVAWVREIGADACIDYKAGPVLPQLRDALKSLGQSGIDIYFDNVGGEHLDAALAVANDHACFPICGMIDAYNSGAALELRFAMRIIAARIRVHGFLFTDFLADMPAFQSDMAAMVKAGQVVARETVFEGLESTPDAFLGLFSGANTGKMLVKL